MARVHMSQVDFDEEVNNSSSSYSILDSGVTEEGEQFIEVIFMAHDRGCLEEEIEQLLLDMTVNDVDCFSSYEEIGFKHFQFYSFFKYRFYISEELLEKHYDKPYEKPCINLNEKELEDAEDLDKKELEELDLESEDFELEDFDLEVWESEDLNFRLCDKIIEKNHNKLYDELDKGELQNNYNQKGEEDNKNYDYSKSYRADGEIYVYDCTENDNIKYSNSCYKTENNEDETCNYFCKKQEELEDLDYKLCEKIVEKDQVQINKKYRKKLELRKDNIELKNSKDEKEELKHLEIQNLDDKPDNNLDKEEQSKIKLNAKYQSEVKEKREKRRKRKELGKIKTVKAKELYNCKNVYKREIDNDNCTRSNIVYPCDNDNCYMKKSSNYNNRYYWKTGEKRKEEVG